jgi:hypothetical protein
MGVHVMVRLVLVAVIGLQWSVIGATIGTAVGIYSTPCATEDSTNCRWDAETMGNGTGRSFIAYRLTDGGPDRVIYLD